MNLRIILLLVIAALAVVFTLQNSNRVPVHLAAWQFESPLALVIAVTLIVGAVAAAIVSAPASMRKSWKLAREERRIAELDQRIRELEEQAAAKDRRIRELEARPAAAAPTAPEAKPPARPSGPPLSV